MTSVSHGLSLDDHDQLALTRERIRATTMSAEGPLHELGAIAITNSDSQGMGRIGETLRRTLQLAHVMKPWAGDDAGTDNERVLRYLAKCTIEPAITHGISNHVGSLQPGRLADIVLWKPAWLGVKPEFVSQVRLRRVGRLRRRELDRRVVGAASLPRRLGWPRSGSGVGVGDLRLPLSLTRRRLPPGSAARRSLRRRSRGRATSRAATCTSIDRPFRSRSIHSMER